MAKQTIGIGSAANDGTGSTLRAAFDICNDNFTELYDGSGGLLHKIEGTNFTGSLLVGHSTTGTLSSAENNTGVGIGALDALTSGDSNVAIGNLAGSAITSAGSNMLIGRAAGDALTSGSYNVAIGHFSLSAEDHHGGNVAIGHETLKVQNAGADAYNVAVGYQAGTAIITGVYNTIIGGLAGDALTTGGNNVAVGYQALSAEDEHGNNVAVGYQALQVLNAGNTGNNVAVGKEAGKVVSTGIKNTILGSKAGDLLETGQNNIIIGYNAEASAVDVSNEITFGDSNITNVRIPADSTLKIGASGDLQLEHLSSNSFIKNTAVGDLYIENQVDSGDVIFRSDDGSGGLATYFYLNGGDTNINFQKDTLHPDNVKAKFGTSADLQIYHDSSHSYVKADGTGDLYIQQFRDDGDIVFQSDDGSGGITQYFRVDGGNTNVLFNQNLVLENNKELRWQDSGGTERTILELTSADDLYFGGSFSGSLIFVGGGSYTERFRIDDSGNLSLPDNVELKIGTGNDLNIRHSGTESFIQNQTGNLTIQNLTDDGDIIFKSDDGSGGTTEYFKLDGSSASGGTVYTNWADNSRITLGAGNDMQLYHDGSNNYVDITLGDLYFTNYTDDKDIIFRSDDGSGGVTEYFRVDGGATKVIASKNFAFLDNIKAEFGDSGDLQLEHDGTNSEIVNTTGNLNIKNSASDGDITFFGDDSSSGLQQYLRMDGGISSMVANVDLLMALDGNGGKIKFGASQDLQIYHDGSNSYIADTGTGDLIISGDNDVMIKDGSGNLLFNGNASNSVELYFGGSKKFETTSAGADVTGTLNLDNLTVDSAQGSDGQVLTSTGSGIAWEDAAGGGVSGTVEGTNFTDSLLVGHTTTGTLSSALRNTGVGLDAMDAITSGDDNVGVGYQTLTAITSGTQNVAIGSYALSTEDAHGKNVAVGYEALKVLDAGSDARNVAVGAESGKAMTTGSTNALLGYQAGLALTSGSGNVAIGNEALKSENAHGRNTAVGNGALALQDAGAHAYNVAVGKSAGGGLTTGIKNTFIGSSVAEQITTGSENVAIGYQALKTEDTNGQNVAIGNEALKTQNGADGNIAIGYKAGTSLTTGLANTAIGYQALKDETTDGFNIAIGYSAMSSSQLSAKNIGIGFQALNNVTNSSSTDTYNIAIGHSSGQAITTGIQNVLMGGLAGDALTTGDNNIVIGYNAAASAVDVDNEITLGDANISAFRCADQSIAALSDGRDKSDVKDSVFGLDFIDSIRPVEFTWDFRPENMAENKQGKKRVGFIAQELQEAMPNGENEILDLVYDINENRIEAKYGNLVPILVKAVQELSAKVKMLENK